MDVLTTAWASTHNQTFTQTIPAGWCARCGQAGPLRATFSVISKTFTAFDEWVSPSGPGLCPACTWGFDTTVLRAAPHLVTRTHGLRALTRTQVRHVLSGGALPVDAALAVPLRPGRKHLLPRATWGQVTVDDATITWTTRDSTLIGVLGRLRAHGFGSRMLTEPAPPFAQLRRCPQAQWPHIMSDWPRLKPWRNPCNPWLALSLHITSPEKGTPC